MVYVGISLPKDTKWNPHQASSFIQALVSGHDFDQDLGIDLDIFATANAIDWVIYTTATEIPNRTTQLIKTYYPDAEIEQYYLTVPSMYPLYLQTAIFCLPDEIDNRLPVFATTDDIKALNDPLIALTNAMDQLHYGEILTFHLKLFSYRDFGTVKKGFLDYLGNAFMDNLAKRSSPFYLTEEQKRRALIEERSQQKISSTYFLVQMVSPMLERFSILENIVSTVSTFSSMEAFNKVVKPKRETIHDMDELGKHLPDATIMRLFKENELPSAYWLRPTEIAALWHLPHDKVTASKINSIVEQGTYVPKELYDIKGIYIGKSFGVDVNLPTDDRTTHTMIIGKTGTGKTTSMHHMITHDIENGHGVMVIDPTGNLISSVLAHSIPDERINDVVLVDFGLEIDGVRYPPPLNPLFRITNDDGSTRIAPDLSSVMNRVYGEEFSNAQMGDLLETVLQFIALEEKPILRDIRRFLRKEQEEYRESLLQKSNNTALVEDWEDIEYQFDKIMKQSFLPLMRRLRAFYRDPQARASTCHPDPLDVPKYVRENKIILVNVSERNNNLGKEERYILGSMVVSQLFNTAQRRQIEGKPFMLYIDETEYFVTMPLAEMLARARQYNIGLVLANQLLSQFKGDQQVVEGTVGAMMSFEIGRPDANIMRHYMNTFEADDLLRLGEYKTAVSLRYKGERLNSFLVNTAPPLIRDADADKTKDRIDQIKRAYRDSQNLKSYDEVNKWIDTRDSNNEDDTTDNDTEIRGDDEFLE